MKRGFLAVIAASALMAPAQADWKAASALSARCGEQALLVWQKGHLVEERYSHGGSPDVPQNLYSITKSLSALGTLESAGTTQLNLDEKVSDAFTEWQKDPWKREITLRELLNQTSGLSPGFDLLYDSHLKNKETAVLRLAAVTAPGMHFAYGPAHYETLEAFIHRKTGEPSLEWLKGAVLNALGIKTDEWRKDRTGHPYFSAGAYVTARHLLTAGQLIRQQGWLWIIPLIPPRLIREATTGSSANPMYGYGLWLNVNANQPDTKERDIEEAIDASPTREDWRHSCLSHLAPTDLIAMVGSNGQRVYISPSRSLVIVRLGRRGGFRDPDFLRAFFR